MTVHCQKAIERWKQNPDAYGLDYYYEFLAEGYLGEKKLEEFEGKVVDEELDIAILALKALLKRNPDNQELTRLITKLESI